MKKDIGAHRPVMTTLFEKILSGDIPSHPVASGEGWYAFLDIFPRREGHTLVIPHRGVQRLADLTPTEQTQLMEGVSRACKRSWASTLTPRISRFAFTTGRWLDRKSLMFTFMCFQEPKTTGAQP